MRRLLLLLSALILAACGGNGDGTKPVPGPVGHVPGINSVTLSQDSATYMEGNGGAVVTAEIEFWDFGLDIQSLRILLPDGTTPEFDQLLTTETGFFSQDFTMPTNSLGEWRLEFRLLDAAGNISRPRYADFSVSWAAQPSNWTSRLSGLPYVLNDVIWDGAVFIAVGGDGSILTSADGIDWLVRNSGTGAGLHAVAALGPDIVVVGSEVVLLSTDQGESWVTKPTPPQTDLTAVAVSSSRLVVGGSQDSVLGPLPVIMVSDDRGDSWQIVDSPLTELADRPNDIIHRDGLFVAVDGWGFGPDNGSIHVSTDGVVWNEIFRGAGLYTIFHDGSRFIAGGDSSVLSSFDGFNWTQMQTPVEGVDYMSAASNGSTLVLAGGYPCAASLYPYPCDSPEPPLPTGLISTDGGMSWDLFLIDGEYHSRGLAFGNGQYVSVGQSTPDSGEGALYTLTTE